MKKRNKEERLRYSLHTLQKYCSFFLLMSFIITCCMLLFLNTMRKTMGLSLSEAGIGRAARITFLNIILLSLFCTAIDGIRRKFMVERPVKQIIKAAERIMAGDLDTRIPPLRGIDREGGLDKIAEYFNKMAEELSGTETLRTDFIANVSHELKTPLAVMQNYGAMLKQPGLAEEKRLEYASAITEASKRLAELISNILKLNKLEN